VPPVFAAIGAAIGAIGTAIAGASILIGGALGVSAIAVSYGIIGGLLIGAKSILGGKKKTDPSRAMLDRLNANIDVRTPRKTVVGHTAFATDIRDEELTGDDQDLLHRWMVLASHEVHSIDEVWFEDKLAWLPGSLEQGEYAGGDWLDANPNVRGSEAGAMNVSSRMPTDSRRYTGMAWIHFRFRCAPGDKSPFGSSVPTRITVRGKGALFYDPRKDSTVPGGSGLHRADDQATWEWDDDACRNPALALLFFLLGWRIENPVTSEMLLAVGKGIPKERIDLESFAVAANICDDVVDTEAGGTEPRYRCDGVWSEGDSPQTVIDMITATMNADLDDVDGQLRLTIFHNDLDNIAANFTEADILDDFEWEPDVPLDQSSNIIRGVYTDPSDVSLYQPADYPQIEAPSPDGIDRIDTFNIPMVQSPGQAQRLAQLRMARELYGSGTFKASFQATAWKVRKNSVVTLTFPKRGWVNKLFRVAEMDIRVDGVVPLILREESPSIYDPPLLFPALDPYDAYPRDPTTSPIYDVLRDLNDMNGDPIAAPTILTNGTAVDHSLRTDGSADISFEWLWGGTESDIDGFEVMVYASTSSSAYTPGTTPAQEMIYAMPPNRRALILTGCPANLYWTFAVTAYRVVSTSVDPTGIIRSTTVKPSLAGENPYRPSSTVPFAGNVTGTVDNMSAATVASGAAAANLGLDSLGVVKTNKVGFSSIVLGSVTSHLTMSSGTTTYGSGSYTTLVSGSITLADAGEVFILWSAQQGYSSVGHWDLQIYVDGSPVLYRGGDAYADAPAATRALTLSAGSHTIVVQWRGSNSGVFISNDYTYVQGNLR
jgi:hypothetical protein